MFALYKCMSSQLLWLDNTCSKQIDTKATITWWLSMFEVFNWRGGWSHPWLGEWEPEAAPFETALWDEGFAKVAALRKEKDKPCAVGLVDMCLHFACCKWFGSKYGFFQYCGLCCLWEPYCTHILLDSFGYVKATWLHECSSYLVTWMHGGSQLDLDAVSHDVFRPYGFGCDTAWKPFAFSYVLRSKFSI